MKQLLTVIYNLFSSMNAPMRVLIGAAGLFIAINTYLNEMWQALFALVDGLVATAATAAGASADFSPLGLINYVFPLDTLCTFLVAYSTLRGVTAGVRMVKSFIPTISG